MPEALKVIGGHESYFTGKLEAYLRAKGIAYQNIPFTMAAVEKAASHTGFFQIPQVQCADGSWLVDTSLIIEYLDQQHPEPVVSVYLPYLLANEAAVLAGREQVSYEALGAGWVEPAKPYRLWGLDQLREKYLALDESARKMVSASLGDANAMDILTTAPTGRCDHLVGTLPYSPTGERLAFDSWGREPQPA